MFQLRILANSWFQQNWMFKRVISTSAPTLKEEKSSIQSLLNKLETPGDSGVTLKKLLKYSPKRELESKKNDPIEATDERIFIKNEIKGNNKIQQIPLINESDIEIPDDNLNLTKLMSALINEFDLEDVDSEAKLKHLVSVMSANTSNTAGSTLKWSRIQPSDSVNKNVMSFTTGERTSLFSGIKPIVCEDKKQEFVSLFEKTSADDSSHLFQNGIPQNLFQSSMLNIDKQWRFPIDNDQDMGIEEQTSFEEHVFLDHFLEEFPDIEPVQRFMELVITGLQQNAYLSVAQKEKQIMWFKDYFEKFPEEDLKLSS